VVKLFQDRVVARGERKDLYLLSLDFFPPLARKNISGDFCCVVRGVKEKDPLFFPFLEIFDLDFNHF